MIKIILPDSSIKEFNSGISVLEIAKNISSSLAKATIGGIVDGKLCDYNYTLTQDSNLKIITDKDNEALEIIRHSAAHLLAQAVKELYPSAQVTIGPVVDNGFYYDFSFERPFTPEDLDLIEKQMQKLVDKNLTITRREVSRADAIDYFNSIGEKYKVELISAISEDQTLSLYTQGDFTDLCRGPHVPSTAKIKAFKLTKLAGAYWRGDANNEMLQRIYGTAWLNKQDLDQYLTMLEEAERRDHRKLGRQLDLFHMQDEAPGMVFWHPKGWAIWQIIEQYIRKQTQLDGYKEIRTPQIVDKVLWEKSGHWDNYASNMFFTSSDSRDYAIKPMNCPCHVLVFNQGLKSYRDLPLRLAEFGSCHRNEPSGSLHGIMRIRNFVQDDAHIFCTDEQIETETTKFINLLIMIYKRFGFDQIEVKLSTRPEKRVGEEKLWDKAEIALANSLKNMAIQYDIQHGEGAFYGPKIEFTLRDNLGRAWQCGTLQLDFNTPARLGANYISEDGTKQVPVMLHRAVLGSMERFIGILIEHYVGLMPLWLAPIQLMILNISQAQILYTEKLQKYFIDKGFRCEIDIANQKVGYKIRENTLQKIPYLIIIGDKEVENNTITVRKVTGEDLGSFTVDEFIMVLNKELLI